MEKVVIDDIDLIVNLVIKRLDNKPYELPSIVGYYETIQEALNLLIKRTDFELVGADFWEPEYDGYDEAYSLFVYDNEITIKKAYSEKLGRYLASETDYAFVEEDFADKYIEANPLTDGVIFGFDDVNDVSEDDENDFSDIPVCICIDDDHKGFCACRFNDEIGDYEKYSFGTDRVLSRQEIYDRIDEFFGC